MIRKLLRPGWNLLAGLVGRGYTKEYNQAVNCSTTADALLAFQRQHLERLLLHAYQNVPYYGRTFAEIGLMGKDGVDLSRFNEIPLLTKDMLRKQSKELTSKDYTTRKWYYYSSGGSTGEPVTFIHDDVYDRWAHAAFYYFHKDILGIDPQEVKKLILWGSDKDLFRRGAGLKAKVVDWLANLVLLNAFKMTEADMLRYTEIINSYKPDIIRGYSGALYELCSYAEARGIELFTPKLVISSAEILSDEMRRTIERVLATKVHDFYGSRETNNLAGECKDGLMHILAFHNYVELIDNHNQPVKEGEEGRVVVTNLHNYSMPFIRYDIGDLAVLGPDTCKCLNVLPTLRKVAGRITDHFIREDGSTVPAEYLIYILGVKYNKGSIRKFQVIQEDYRRIRILVVPERVIEESEKSEIGNAIKLVMGQDCQVAWQTVDDIPKTESGKYYYTKSLLHK